MPNPARISPPQRSLDFVTDTEKSAEEPISGLSLFADWLSPSEEAQLLETIDAQTWSNDLKRRVQHYGIRYDYKRRGLIREDELEPLPDWLVALSERLMREGKIDALMQQAIINEYEPGQGISKHVDNPCFDSPIVSLSLGSTCEMRFEHVESSRAQAIVLQPRSLLIMADEARWQWRHSIAARRSDRIDGYITPRKRRVSITFRRLKANAQSR
ncbi:MAG: alpha-ketoglutarate-dependent dioxygenase AlkB [Polyangiaceae bacterium]